MGMRDAGPGRPRNRGRRARLVAFGERHGTGVARVAGLAGLRTRRWIDDALEGGWRRRRRDAGVVAELQAGGVRVGGGAGLTRETGRGRSVFDTLEELRRRWDACCVARGDCGVRAVWRLLARRRAWRRVDDAGEHRWWWRRRRRRRIRWRRWRWRWWRRRWRLRALAGPAARTVAAGRAPLAAARQRNAHVARLESPRLDGVVVEQRPLGRRMLRRHRLPHARRLDVEGGSTARAEGGSAAEQQQ